MYGNLNAKEREAAIAVALAYPADCGNLFVAVEEYESGADFADAWETASAIKDDPALLSYG